jgi:hypothetical protein
MVEQRQSALQRIQVGLVGLVVVLLFVSLANMVLDRVSDGKQAGVTFGDAAIAAPEDLTPDEPLAELGVTPVAKDDSTDAAKAPTEKIRRAQPSSRP